MKIKFTEIFLTVMLFFFLSGLCNVVHTQTIAGLERQLSIAQKDVHYARVKLDSLKNALNERAKIIERAKKKSTKSEDEILGLMSASVSITNDYRSQEMRVKALEYQVDNLKETLDKKYSRVIDSLKILQASHERNINRENIDKLILRYTEKKLLIAPQIASLSISPEKLTKLDVSKSTDVTERKIIKEYLTTALKEVNTYLAQIDDENDEIEEITLLQKKTQQFLDETDFTYQIRPITVASKSTESSSFDGETVTEKGNPAAGLISTDQLIVPQLESYSRIMNQLSFMNSQAGLSKRGTIETAKSTLSLNEYIQFLRELESRLKEYKLILQNKAAGIDE